MGEVVTLPLRDPPAPGNGARAALAVAFVDMGVAADLAYVDLLLMWLWYHGYKIVPVD